MNSFLGKTIEGLAGSEEGQTGGGGGQPVARQIISPTGQPSGRHSKSASPGPQADQSQVGAPVGVTEGAWSGGSGGRNGSGGGGTAAGTAASSPSCVSATRRATGSGSDIAASGERKIV